MNFALFLPLTLPNKRPATPVGDLRAVSFFPCLAGEVDALSLLGFKVFMALIQLMTGVLTTAESSESLSPYLAETRMFGSFVCSIPQLFWDSVAGRAGFSCIPLNSVAKRTEQIGISLAGDWLSLLP